MKTLKITVIVVLLGLSTIVRSQKDTTSIQLQNALLKDQIKLQKEQYEYLKSVNKDILDRKFEALKAETEANEKNQWIVFLISALVAIGGAGVALFRTLPKGVSKAVAKLIGERMEIVIDSIAEYKKRDRFKKTKKILVISDNEQVEAGMRKQLKDTYENISYVIFGTANNIWPEADIILINDYEGKVENSYVKNILDTNLKTCALWFTKSKTKEAMQNLNFANSYATLPNNLKQSLDSQDKLTK